ncbi:hypothetical protein M0R88_08730 [Halorussus gelatinilyticus]|uniref:DUF8152 domain-containing protein n=1 Tax=Halorussus gelatinilyticus TaxID=2937524 RepID=A0A8U0IPW9_9EURY|nr:hypothetical protein [Halorussus gelatinilyticus]UPW02164.1 hypothetical protein M0R88_08730 [Halorussus gelatinilyticus]
MRAGARFDRIILAASARTRGVANSDDESEDLRSLVADLHARLEATAQLPVEARASQWLGEAEAVVGDAVGPDVPEAVVEKRVGQVQMLLSNVDSTGNEAADERVSAARELVEEIESRF